MDNHIIGELLIIKVFFFFNNYLLDNYSIIALGRILNLYSKINPFNYLLDNYYLKDLIIKLKGIYFRIQV